jgi:hypothetical protein
LLIHVHYVQCSPSAPLWLSFNREPIQVQPMWPCVSVSTWIQSSSLSGKTWMNEWKGYHRINLAHPSSSTQLSLHSFNVHRVLFFNGISSSSAPLIFLNQFKSLHLNVIVINSKFHSAPPPLSAQHRLTSYRFLIVQLRELYRRQTGKGLAVFRFCFDPPPN